MDSDAIKLAMYQLTGKTLEIGLYATINETLVISWLLAYLDSE